MFETTYLADVDPSLVLIISPVTDRQAQLVMDVGPVQIHFLVRHTHKLISHTWSMFKIFSKTEWKMVTYLLMFFQTDWIYWLRNGIVEQRRSINHRNESFSWTQGGHWLSQRPADRMRDGAADCRQAESRFSHVNTCNLTDTDKDKGGAVLGGQRMGSVRVNLPKTESQLNAEGDLFH